MYTMSMHEDSEREEGDSGVDSATTEPENIVVRIVIDDIKEADFFQLNLDESVWIAKLKILANFGQQLRDSLNYGLYMPPTKNGRAGKFLHEERPLRDYPLLGTPAVLEFRYKRRVFRVMSLNVRKLKQLHTKANLKQLVDYIRRNDLKKATKMLLRGLDPNFFDKKTSDTPLALATKLKNPEEMLMALVEGGAHLDFRSPENGLTPVHKAVINGNKRALKILFELGASANYKDMRGLTPLYHAISTKCPDDIVSMLLQEQTILNVKNEEGSTELHQACQRGLSQQVEQLIFYGADLNEQNTAGNTALHVCALYGQTSCTNVLLFRGADKNLRNANGLTALAVAQDCGHFETSVMIEKHTSNAVENFTDSPIYTIRRRTPDPGALIGVPNTPLRRAQSVPHVDYEGLDSVSNSTAPSPMIGKQFRARSQGDLLSATTMSGTLPVSSSNATGPSSRSGQFPAFVAFENDDLHAAKANGSIASSDSTVPHRRLYAAAPGRQFICINSYLPSRQGEMHLVKGDLVDVMYVGEGGFWEGSVGEKRHGWFPSNCVQEVHHLQLESGEDSIIIQKKTLAAMLAANDSEHAPRTVVLQRGDDGYGFVLRGAKAEASRLLTYELNEQYPALQHFESVEPGSPAFKTGIKQGDFLLEVNGVDVVQANHEYVSQQIRNSGEVLAMKVITPRKLDRIMKPIGFHVDSDSPDSQSVQSLPRSERAVSHSALINGPTFGTFTRGANRHEYTESTPDMKRFPSLPTLDAEATPTNNNFELRAAAHFKPDRTESPSLGRYTVQNTVIHVVPPQPGEPLAPKRRSKSQAPIPPVRMSSTDRDSLNSGSSSLSVEQYHRKSSSGSLEPPPASWIESAVELPKANLRENTNRTSYSQAVGENNDSTVVETSALVHRVSSDRPVDVEQAHLSYHHQNQNTRPVNHHSAVVTVTDTPRDSYPVPVAPKRMSAGVPSTVAEDGDYPRRIMPDLKPVASAGFSSTNFENALKSSVADRQTRIQQRTSVEDIEQRIAQNKQKQRQQAEPSHSAELAAAVARRKQNVENGTAALPSKDIDKRISIFKRQQAPRNATQQQQPQDTPLTTSTGATDSIQQPPVNAKPKSPPVSIKPVVVVEKQQPADTAPRTAFNVQISGGVQATTASTVRTQPLVVTTGNSSNVAPPPPPSYSSVSSTSYRRSQDMDSTVSSLTTVTQMSEATTSAVTPPAAFSSSATAAPVSNTDKPVVSPSGPSQGATIFRSSRLSTGDQPQGSNVGQSSAIRTASATSSVSTGTGSVTSYNSTTSLTSMAENIRKQLLQKHASGTNF